MLQEIKTLIGNGYSERRIADELKISRDILRTILRKNNLQTKHVVQKRSNDYPERFNKYYKNKWEYVSGYVNNNCTITVMCNVCGHLQSVNAGALRKHFAIRCQECVLREKKIMEENQASEQLQRKREKEKAKEDKAGAEMMRRKELYKPKACAECGKEFIPQRLNRRYCSIQCSNKHENRKKETSRRVKITKNGTVDWSISIEKLINKDKNRCHICGGKTNANDHMNVNGVFIAGPKYPSIDHVVPLSKGGTHTWDNVKLAHMSCNTVKSDKIFYEGCGGQVTIAV